MLMVIFMFDDYKEFFRDKLKTMPKKGHGQLLKIAKLFTSIGHNTDRPGYKIGQQVTAGTHDWLLDGILH